MLMIKSLTLLSIASSTLSQYVISGNETLSQHIIDNIIASYNFDEVVTKDSTGDFDGIISKENGISKVEGIYGSAL